MQRCRRAGAGLWRRHRFAGQATLQAQRHAAVGGFGQRRRQGQRHTLQAAVDLQLGHAPAQGQCQGIGRAAAGVLRQAREQTQLPRLLQALRRGHALGAQLQGRFGGRSARRQCAHAAFKAHFAAQRTGLHALQSKAGVRELHRAARTRQHRGIGGHAHLVARQHHAALHLGVVNIADGQTQVQLQIGVATATGLGQRLPGHGVQRRVAHERQQLRQRPARLRTDGHHGVGQVGDVRLHLGQARVAHARKGAAGVTHLHGRALKHQLTSQLGQRGPGQLARALQAGGHVGVGHILDAGGNPELAQFGVVERHVVQVALDAKVRAGSHARHHGVAHIVAGILGNGQGQIAVYPRAIGAAEGAAQVQHTRKARTAGRSRRIAGVPGGAQLALGIGVGKVRFAHLHGNALASQLPAHLAAQLCQWQPGVFKHAGQHQGAIGHAHRGLACGLGHFQLHVGAAQAQCPAGAHRCCAGQCQARDAGAHLVTAWSIPGPLPVSLHGVHQSFRGVGAQCFMGGLAQRQALGHARQRGQIQPVGLEFALRRCFAAGVGIAHAQVAARPVQAVVAHPLQALRVQLKAPCQPPRAQAPLHRGQPQRLQIRRQRGVDIGQRHIGHGAHPLAALQVQPGTQCAPALCQRHAQVGVQVQAGHIHPRKIGKQLPAPLLPAATVRGQQRLAKQPGDVKTIAPLGRRRGVQPQLVAPGAVAQQHIDLAQRQRGSGALLVRPAHRATAHHHLGLRKKPIDGAAVIAGTTGQGQSGDEHLARAVTANVQLGALDVELLKPEAPQRARRQRQHHALQAQRFAPLGIQQRHLAQFNGRNQPLRVRREGANAHGYPQRAFGLRLQLHAVFADSRHNRAVQSPPGHRQHQGSGQQQPQRPPRKPRQPPKQAWRVRNRVSHGRRGGGQNYDPQPPRGFRATQRRFTCGFALPPRPCRQF